MPWEGTGSSLPIAVGDIQGRGAAGAALLFSCLWGWLTLASDNKVDSSVLPAFLPAAGSKRWRREGIFLLPMLPWQTEEGSESDILFSHCQGWLNSVLDPRVSLTLDITVTPFAAQATQISTDPMATWPLGTNKG